MNSLKSSLREILRYPSAIFGSIIILMLVVLAAYAMIKIPYQEAIRLWRGGEEVWYRNPKFAAPAWTNFFSSRKLPESFAVNTANGSMQKTVTPGEEGTGTVDIAYAFDFTYDDFPQEMFLYFKTKFKEKQPFVSILWQTPDGREIRIGSFGVNQTETIVLRKMKSSCFV